MLAAQALFGDTKFLQSMDALLLFPGGGTRLPQKSLEILMNPDRATVSIDVCFYNSDMADIVDTGLARLLGCPACIFARPGL